ncbi:MAG: hypothetical protein ACRD2I_06660, partial [Vicinamibacterales bacterium]
MRAANVRLHFVRRYGLTVIGALFVTPLTVTRIDGVVVVETGWVCTANDALVAPAANVVCPVVGVAADAFVLSSAAVSPPAGAGHSIVAVPFDV